jgi:DNA polymerase
MGTEWAALARTITSCTACAELAVTRQKVVVGDPGPGLSAQALPAQALPRVPGPEGVDPLGGEGHSTRLVFVGEAPGAQEDAAGRPFVGKGGQLLDQLLSDAGMARAEVGVVNIIKCRPPGNRQPKTAEIANCRPYLERQLELMRPRLIVALGLTAASWFLGRRTTLAAARGTVHEIGARRLIATYHPSAAIRFGPSGAPMAALREDLDFAARYLSGVTR